MAFWVSLLRPVFCCSGLSRALFVRPSLCGSVASASAAAAAGCSDRFGFTSRDGSVAAPGGAESRPFSAGRVGCGSFCPGSGFGGWSRLWCWRFSRFRFRLRLRCWRLFRVRWRCRSRLPVPVVLAFVPGAVLLSVPVSALVLAVVPVPAAGAKRPGERWKRQPGGLSAEGGSALSSLARKDPRALLQGARGSIERTDGFPLRLCGLRLFRPDSVIDVPVLNHAVCEVVRDDDVIQDEDPDPVQKALKLGCAGDVLRAGGAGSARVVVAKQD